MRRIDNARLEALQRALETLNSNQTVFETFKPLKARHDALKAKLVNLETLRNSLSVSSEGSSAEKRASFAKLRDLTVDLAKIGEVWAHEQQLPHLLPIFDIEPSDFQYATFLDALELAKNVEQALRPHLKDLVDFEVTATDLEALLDAIEQSRDLMPKPRLQISEKKSINEAYRVQLNEAGVLARQIENLLLGKFRTSHADFVNRFIASSRIYDPHTRKTAVRIEVTNALGQPLPDVVCDILELIGEEQSTDEHGKAEILGIRAGSYTLEVKKPGLTASKHAVTVKRGQKVQLKLQLDA